MKVPTDLRYSREHGWARDVGDGRVRVGITDFAQDALGDIVYVDLPEVGAVVTTGARMGEIESTKSVTDLACPVNGSVTEQNALVTERPELVNEQPFGDGWLVTIETSDPAQLENMMAAAAYETFVRQVDG